MIVFVHVERTAGSTIHSWFHPDNMPCLRGRHFVVSGPGELPPISKALDRRKPYYAGGHFSYHDAVGAGLLGHGSELVFSITRDPAERAASLFMLMRRSPDWLPHVVSIVGDRGAEYFYDVCEDKGWFFPNGLCKRIAGSDRFSETEQFVRHNYSFVGSSERMELVKQELLTRVTMPDFQPHSARLNAAMEGRSATEVLGASLADRIRRSNEADLQLHAWVNENGIISRQ